MRNRNILKMILLTVVTFGIYYLYWLVSTTREMRAKGADIPNAILIIIPIVNIWWMWKYSKGVEHVTNEKLSAVLTFILMYVVGFIGIYIVQDSFNGVSAASGAGSPVTANTGGQAQAPAGHPVDPAVPSATHAAAATGAGVGVVASQAGNNTQANPAPQTPEPPKQQDTPQQQPADKPEDSSSSTDSTEQPPSEDQTAPQGDNSLDQSGSDPTQQPSGQDSGTDNSQGTDNTPPADDPTQSMGGPSL